MELRFDAMLFHNLGNGKFDAGHIKCSHGPQVPNPCKLFTHKHCFHCSGLRMRNFTQTRFPICR